MAVSVLSFIMTVSHCCCMYYYMFLIYRFEVVKHPLSIFILICFILHGFALGAFLGDWKNIREKNDM